MDAPLLFVYGTLRKGAGHPMHRVLRDGARYVGPATVRGALYDLGGIPGLRLEGDGTVHGEVYALTQPTRVLLDLDDYEGEGYDRLQVEARVDGTGVRTAWAYLWGAPVDEGAIIASGDWLAPRAGRRAGNGPERSS